MDMVARMMGGISEIDDLDSMREQSQKLLQHKILEVAEEQSKVAGAGHEHKVLCLCATARLYGCETRRWCGEYLTAPCIANARAHTCTVGSEINDGL
jgi:hypothetical protein